VIEEMKNKINKQTGKAIKKVVLYGFETHIGIR